MPKKSRRNPMAPRNIHSARSKAKHQSKLRAYAPRNKRKFKKMSNPLAENKQIQGSQLSATVGTANGSVVLSDYSIPPIDQYGAPTGAQGHSLNSMHWNFNPDSMIYQTQGLDDSQMIGRSVYQTLCAAKFLIKWPQPSMNTGHDNAAGSGKIMGKIPDQPNSHKLYWGYVPKKMLFTNETTPPVDGASAFDIETLVNQRVRDYFNARQDRIQFIPKKTATIKIIGSKKLYPPWDRRTARQPTTYVHSTVDEDEDVTTAKTVIDGSIPDTLVKIKWPINRKIHFEGSDKFGYKPAAGSIPAENIPLDNGATVFYRNYDHIPFAVIVSWNHDALPPDDPTNPNVDLRYERTRRCPQVLVNDITYYRDS